MLPPVPFFNHTRSTVALPLRETTVEPHYISVSRPTKLADYTDGHYCIVAVLYYRHYKET